MDVKPVENVRQFGTNLYRHAIDAVVTLEITRDLAKMILRVPVIERPDDPSRFLEMVNPVVIQIERHGMLSFVAFEID